MYGRHEGNPDLEERDRRLAAAPKSTGWPLVKQHFAAIDCPASMLLMSHNLFHRGARRHPHPEDDALPRFMFRFMLYRTTDPCPPSNQQQPPPPPPPESNMVTAVDSHDQWTQKTDEWTGVNLSQATTDCTVIWDDVRAWITGQSPPPLLLSAFPTAATAGSR